MFGQLYPSAEGYDCVSAIFRRTRVPRVGRGKESILNALSTLFFFDFVNLVMVFTIFPSKVLLNKTKGLEVRNSDCLNLQLNNRSKKNGIKNWKERLDCS